MAFWHSDASGRRKKGVGVANACPSATQDYINSWASPQCHWVLILHKTEVVPAELAETGMGRNKVYTLSHNRVKEVFYKWKRALLFRIFALGFK